MITLISKCKTRIYLVYKRLEINNHDIIMSYY